MKKECFLVIAILIIMSYVVKANAPELLVDNCKLKKLSHILNSDEIRIDSLVIPALTLGELKEIRPDGKGGINSLVVQFLTTNKVKISLNFIRKELVNEKPTKNPKSFVLRGKAELGYKYRLKNIFETNPSIPKTTEDCVLLFIK